MAIVELKLRLVGEVPLLMHNGQLADPTNKWTKALKDATSRKGKTEADHLEIRRVEWFGSLYLDDDGKIAIPADCVLGVAINGAKKTKHGELAKAGILAAAAFFPFDFPGPKDPEKLWEDGRFSDYRAVGVRGNRVMRSRPIFKKWTSSVTLHVIDDVISPVDVEKAFVDGGVFCGLGDFTPRYGRFSVERVSLKELSPKAA